MIKVHADSNIFYYMYAGKIPCLNFKFRYQQGFCDRRKTSGYRNKFTILGSRKYHDFIFNRNTR